MFDFVATSYAAGHNFWPGTPLSWWVRGSMGFLLVAAPQMLMLMLAVGWCRRTTAWRYCLVALVACAATYVLWPAIIGLNYRDADMPWYIGLRWGDRARFWLLAISMVGCVAAVTMKVHERRGFPVIPKRVE